VALHWQDATTGRIDEDHPLGSKTIDWTRTVDTLRVKVRQPGDGAWKQLEPSADELQLSTPPLHRGATLVFSFDGHGLRVGGRERAWQRPEPSLLAAAGRYELQIAGELALEGAPVAFET